MLTTEQILADLLDTVTRYVRSLGSGHELRALEDVRTVLTVLADRTLPIVDAGQRATLLRYFEVLDELEQERPTAAHSPGRSSARPSGA